jgi:hypothetical protein
VLCSAYGDSGFVVVGLTARVFGVVAGL